MGLNVGGMSEERLQAALSLKADAERSRRQSEAMLESWSRRKGLEGMDTKGSKKLRARIQRLRERYAENVGMVILRKRYGMTSKRVHAICTGEIYPHFPGPISEKRQTRSSS